MKLNKKTLYFDVLWVNFSLFVNTDIKEGLYRQQNFDHSLIFFHEKYVKVTILTLQ